MEGRILIRETSLQALALAFKVFGELGIKMVLYGRIFGPVGVQRKPGRYCC